MIGEAVKEPAMWGFFMGDTLGEGGGVGVRDWRCFSAIVSSICTSTERMVETCCCMR